MKDLSPLSYYKSVSIYLVFNVLSALLPIITLPIFTRYMTPSDYGILAIFNIMCMFSGNIFRLELNAALKRVYATNINDFPVYLNTAISFSNKLLILCVITLLALLPWLHDYNGVTTPWFFAILLLAYLRFQTVVLHHLLQLTNRPLLYGVWGLVANLATFGLTFLFLFWNGLGWQARSFSELLVALVSFPIAIIFFRKDFALRRQFDWNVLKTMLRFSLPLLMSSMIGYLLLVMDRLFIAELVGQKKLGLYAVAVQLSAIVGLFFGAILPVWESWIYRKTSNLNLKDLSQIMRWLFIVILISLLFNFLAPLALAFILPFLVDQSFAGVDLFLQPVITSALVVSIYGMTVPILTFMRKVTFIVKINIMMLILSFPILYFCIQEWGTVGAAYGLTIVYGTGLSVGLIYIYKTLKQTSIATNN